MKNRKTLSFLLCASMLSGSFTGLPVFAQDGVAVQAENADIHQIPVLDDQASDLQFALKSHMQIVEQNGADFLQGYMTLGKADAYDNLLEGSHSFTFQIVSTPGDCSEYNQLVSKGDESLNIREYVQVTSSGNYVPQIVAKNSDGFKPLSYPDEYGLAAGSYKNQEHVITAGYDAQNQNLFLYLDDGEAVELGGVASINETAKPLTIGQDADKTERLNASLFKSIKLFAGVKTPAEIAELDADNTDCVLWVEAEHSSVVTVDCTALRTVYEDCKNASANDYSPRAWAEFEQARDEAAALLADPGVQGEIDEAAAKLNASWLALRLVPSKAALEALGK